MGRIGRQRRLDRYMRGVAWEMFWRVIWGMVFCPLTTIRAIRTVVLADVKEIANL
jgi:hypothetical protein